MRFLASFASTPETRAYRIDELVAVAEMFAIPMRFESLLPPWESVSAKQPLSVPVPIDAASLENPKSVTELADASSAPQGSGPFAYVDLPSVADAQRIASRCVMLDTLALVYCECASATELIAAVIAALHDSQQGGCRTTTSSSSSTSTTSSSGGGGGGGGGASVFNIDDLVKHLSPDVTFRYDVESVERKIPQTEKLAIIKRFEAVGHRGSINLHSPDARFKVVFQHDPASKAVVRVMFGREVAATRRGEWMDRFGLKKRPYIGTTSMPPELTFLMANLAHVQPGDFVYDPFCGTGSSLVTATALGAHCIGSDMDGRAMRSGSAKSHSSVLIQQQQQVAMRHYDLEKLTARRDDDFMRHFGPQENILTPAQLAMESPLSMLANFNAYKLWTWPERVRMNFSVSAKLWRPLAQHTQGGWLDCIISDPPYGIREQKLCVGEGSEEASRESNQPSFSATCLAGAADAQDYDVREMMLDLVTFAAKALRVGGRLVYWHPTTHLFTTDELVRHPSMKLKSCIAQQVNLKLTRVLVTLVKTSDAPESLSKDDCRPRQRPENVRKLMDATEAPNPSYASYKAHKQRKWEGNHAYFEEKRKRSSMDGHADDRGGAHSSDGEGAGKGAAPKSKRQLKREVAQRMAEQRSRNLELQGLRHRLSILEGRSVSGLQLSVEEAAELEKLQRAIFTLDHGRGQWSTSEKD